MKAKEVVIPSEAMQQLIDGGQLSCGSFTLERKPAENQTVGVKKRVVYETCDDEYCGC